MYLKTEEYPKKKEQRNILEVNSLPEVCFQWFGDEVQSNTHHLHLSFPAYDSLCFVYQRIFERSHTVCLQKTLQLLGEMAQFGKVAAEFRFLGPT